MCSVATASLVLIWSKPKVRAKRRASSLMPLTWADVLSRLGPCSWTSSLNSCRESSDVDICELGNTFIEKDVGSKPAPSESSLCDDFLHWDITESLSLARISFVTLMFASCPPSCTCVELMWWNSAPPFPEFHLSFSKLIKKVLHPLAVLLSTSIIHQIRWCFKFGDQNCSSSTVAPVSPPLCAQHRCLQGPLGTVLKCLVLFQPVPPLLELPFTAHLFPWLLRVSWQAVPVTILNQAALQQLFSHLHKLCYHIINDSSLTWQIPPWQTHTGCYLSLRHLQRVLLIIFFMVFCQPDLSVAPASSSPSFTDRGCFDTLWFFWKYICFSQVCTDLSQLPDCYRKSLRNEFWEVQLIWEHLIHRSNFSVQWL